MVRAFLTLFLYNQKIAGAMSRGQEERRAVQGGVLKRMRELESKCGIIKSSKVDSFGVTLCGCVLHSCEPALR